jgi:shikimate kinase
MKVITLNGQAGSWNDYIGKEVSNSLGMKYIDRETILEVTAV